MKIEFPVADHFFYPITHAMQTALFRLALLQVRLNNARAARGDFNHKCDPIKNHFEFQMC